MVKGFLTIAMIFVLLSSPIVAQTIPTLPCTSSMLTSFTPCINYLTGSSATGTSPTTDCCNSLKAVTINGTGCLCQIVTGGVPFKIPLNRSLAIALPKACKQPGVPVQCKASPGAPLPAPGPTAAFGPSASSAESPSDNAIPTIESPTLAPVSDTTPTSAGSVPTTSTGTGSTLTQSAATPAASVSPLLILCSAAFLIMRYI